MSAMLITTLTGPLFITLVIDWALFGVLTTQVYYYSQGFPNDRRTLKALVYSVYLLQLTQTLLRTVTSWKMLASGFGDIDDIDTVSTTAWLSLCVTGGGVAFMVQWFYAHRLAVLSKSKTLAIVIVLISTIAYAGALASGIIAKHANRISKLLANHRSQIFTTTGVWGGAAAVCDAMITVCTYYHLQKQRGKGFQKTQALLSKIIRTTVETGAVTAFFSILSMALFYLPGRNGLNYDTAPLFAAVDFHAVAMLAVLCSRINLVVAFEPTTWHDNELAFAAPRATRDTNGVDPNISTSGGHLPSSSAFRMTEPIAQREQA
ncbi:hypothetical protein BJ912DRAFT_457636 [Pholiota molesta]|nr:hypothetical protein BJ912DRAFT_457636 [Pholiota molesta]